MLHDDLLGELEWNPRSKDWDGQAEVSGQCVSLEVSPLEGQADAAALAAARTGLLWVQEHEPVARQTVAASFIDEANQFWSYGQDMSVDEFADACELCCVELHGNGSVTLHYDNELCRFRGRWLKAEFSPERNLVKIDLEK
jgi:hypothetical protein